MSIEAQGTHLYFVSGSSVITAGAVTTISGIAATRDQIEVTSIADTARRYVAGLITPGAATFTINFDPEDPSHIALHDLYESGASTKWALGLSDNTGAPTLDTDGAFVFPASRTFIEFDGYVSNFPLEFALSAVVTSALTVQISGFPQLIPAT